MFFKKRLKKIESPEFSKPSELDLLFFSFPNELHDDVATVIEVLKDRKYWKNFFSENRFSAHYQLEVLLIPYRFYAEEVSEMKLTTFSFTQLTILNCIYSRSGNGYLRQKYIEKLLQLESVPIWVYPYIIKLCGEYVVEILRTIDDHFDHIDKEKFTEFVNVNKALIHLEYCHMASYWDAYHRYFGVPKLKGFIGFEIFKKRFGYSRSFERFYLDTLPPKEPKLRTKFEIFKRKVDLNQNYFYLPIDGNQISAEQLGLKKSVNNDEYVRSSDGSIWRERLLYNTGQGQPKGFERLPTRDFDQLIYIVLSYKRGVVKLAEIESRQNTLGSIAVIMEDHLDEFIEFLIEQINNTDLFDDDQYRENLKLFCLDSTRTTSVGGIGQFSYEEILNTRWKWYRISEKVKRKIYNT